MTMKLHLPAGYAICSLNFTGAAVPLGAAVVLCVNHSGSSFDPAGLGNQLVTLYGTHLKSTITPDVTLSSVRVKYGPMETGVFAQVSANVVGTDTGFSDAPPVALLVKKSSTIGGKAGAGRLYMPGLGSTRVDVGGNVQASDITTRQTAWNAFLAACVTASIPLQVPHTSGTYVNKKGETVTVPDRDPTSVVALLVQQRCGTQRRRQRR